MHSRTAICCLVLGALAVAACSSETEAPGLVLDDTIVADPDAVGDIAGDATQTNDTIQQDDAVADVAEDAVEQDATADITEVTATYANCPDLVQCITLACASGVAGCEKACLADASSAAIVAAAPLLMCVQGTCQAGLCKGSQDPKCVDQCIQSKCMSQLYTCLDDGTVGPAACKDASACFDGCSLAKEDGLQCMASCYNGLTAKAKTRVQAISDCVAKSTSADPMAACGAEVMACLLEGQSGSLECWQLFDCNQTCAPERSDGDCLIKCLSQASPAAQQKFTPLLPCLGQTETTPECATAFMGCVDPTGSKTCWDAMTCANECKKAAGDTDPGPGCAFGCLHQSKPAAAAQALELFNCNSDGGALTPECQDKYIQCLDPQGTKTCSQTLACAANCGQGNDSCGLACLKEATPQAAGQAWSAMQCFGQTTTECTDTTIACLDPKGLGDCKTVMGCMNLCAGKPACGLQCFDLGSKQAATEAFAFISCNAACDDQCKTDMVCKGICMAGKCAGASLACGF